MQQRLQKIIAAAGYCSRRRAEELIAAGRIHVDGHIAQLGEQADAEVNVILIDDKPLKAAENLVYFLLNKPLGTVTTLSDPEGRPVVSDLFRDLPVRLFPVGRLDINASGLLLMTNDGALANSLAHPSHQVDKIYLVKVRGRVTEESKMSLENGVVLEDGLTAPAKVSNLRVRGSHTWFELTIHEGRNRQVRRMCEALGHQVNRLVRIGYAFLTLDDLAPGQKRMLTAQEIARLKRLGKRSLNPGKRPANRK
jgi:23S rRNA pseudouridine2605 synthase